MNDENTNDEANADDKDGQIKNLKAMLRSITRKMLILCGGLLFSTFLLYNSMLRIRKHEIVHGLQKKISERKSEVIADLSEATKNLSYVIDQPYNSSAELYFSKGYNAYRKAHFKQDIVDSLEDSLAGFYKKPKCKPSKIIIRR